MNKAQQDLDALASCCTQGSHALQATWANTADLLHAMDQIQKDLATSHTRSRLISDFLQQYELTSAQSQALKVCAQLPGPQAAHLEGGARPGHLNQRRPSAVLRGHSAASLAGQYAVVVLVWTPAPAGIYWGNGMTRLLVLLCWPGNWQLLHVVLVEHGGQAGGTGLQPASGAA